MRFHAASILLALMAATDEVEAGLSPFRVHGSSHLSQKTGWFAGTAFRGGSMGKPHTPIMAHSIIFLFSVKSSCCLPFLIASSFQFGIYRYAHAGRSRAGFRGRR